MIKVKRKRYFKIEFLLLIVVALLGAIYIRYTWIKIEKDSLNDALQNVISIEASLDEGILDSLNAVEDDFKKPQYIVLKKTLKKIIDTNKKARFVYIYTLRKGNLFFYGDSEPENSEDISPPGQEYSEAEEEYFQPFISGLPSFTKPVTDRWGTWISILVPIKDKNNDKTIAVLAMDYSAKSWNSQLWIEVIKSSMLVLLIMLVISVLLLIRVKNKSLKSEIEERIQAEKDLEKNKQQLSDIIQFLPDATFAVDKNRKVFIWNKAIEIMTGVSASEMIGKSKNEYLIPFYGESRFTLLDLIFEDLDDISINYPNIICEGNAYIAESFCKELNNKNGAWVFNKVSPLHDTKGEIIGAIESIRDITFQKKSAEELVNAKNIAEESDRLKSAFLANMSHEIRTPMNSILGFADLLKEPELTGEKQEEYISIIEKSGNRMLNIINDIIDISKIEAGLMLIKKSETDINEQIHTIHAMFLSEAEKKGIDITVSLALPANHAKIITDREKLFAIITNLVKNAIKFTQEGKIEFGYTKEAGFIKFFVKDTGIGIPENRQQIVFDRFIQVDIPDRNVFQGAGLGLSISKAFVEMIGGEINVESEEGIGSVFSFNIPYITDENRINLRSTKIDSILNKNKIRNLKILIAEDDDSSAYLLKQNLEKHSHTIIFACNGKEAVEIFLKNSDIDLILMDIKMPVLNGYEATNQIRKFNKDVIIIAQTAFALNVDEELALEAGCNAHVSKPINFIKLHTLINKFFRE